ncbi:MAG: hypothetical protein IM638_01255 [Bacteroidetes bacterium]|nr:hypothetical protein [Bacteroidota bacterium]
MAFLAFASAVNAQDSEKQFSGKWSFEAGISETRNFNLVKVIGVENKVFNVLHPYFYASADYNFKVRHNRRTYAGIEIGFHKNTLVDESFQFNLTIGGNYRLFKGFYGGWEIGLGMQQARRADLVYKYNGEKWVAMTYPGKFIYTRQIIRPQAELGYRFTKLPLDVFVNGNVIVIRNWFSSDVPLGASFSVAGIGVRWHL